MGWHIEEKVAGRIRNNADIQREYIMVHDGIGASDETAATLALFDFLQIPENIPEGADPINFPQTDIGASEIYGRDPISYEGRGTWAARIKTPAGTVQSPTPVDMDEMTFSFNGQAKGGHIQTSIKTVWKESLLKGLGYEPLFGAPKGFNGLINVEGKGKDMKFKGLDLNPPPTTFEINWIVPKTVLTEVFIEDLMKWLGTTNELPFTLFGHSFLSGELFYSSVQGTRRTNEDWEVSVGFAFSRDRMTDKIVLMVRGSTGQEMLVPRKGHEYIWVYNLPAWDADLKDFSRPADGSGAFVEQVWEEKSWAETSLDGLQTLVMP